MNLNSIFSNWSRREIKFTFSAFNKRVNGENASCDVTFSQKALQQELEYLGSVVPPAPEDDDEDGDA